MSEAYKAAGVNLELGDELSTMLYEASKQTWANRAGRFGEPVSEYDSFSGLRDLSMEPLLNALEPGGIRLYMGDDGIGTKVEVAQRVGDHSTMAFDLLAMVCDDAAIRGYEPAAVTTTLDVQKLDENKRSSMLQLAGGYIAAANAARVALVNGEVAELGGLVGGYEFDDKSFKYNWSATVLAAGHQKRLLTGAEISPGDFLVGFREYGFRSNGLSLVRKILEDNYGPLWHEGRNELEKNIGRLVLTPSTIYSPILVDAIGGYDLRREPTTEIFGAAHITGGGIPGKLGRMLRPSNLGADIENPFDPPELMLHLQDMQSISDEEIYKVWNMGQGMIVASNAPREVIDLASEHDVEAQIVGRVTAQPGITIRSAGNSKGSRLVYPVE